MGTDQLFGRSETKQRKSSSALGRDSKERAESRSHTLNSIINLRSNPYLYSTALAVEC